MRTVDVGGTNLAVEERGAGTPLLFVHGFPLDHTMWRYQLEALSGDCRVVAPDLRGFGKSDVTAGTVTMERFADDLAALLEALGVEEPVVFCGLSMGGYIGWEFARKHASKLKALIVCDSKAAADAEDARRNRFKMAEVVREHGMAAVADAMIPRLLSESTAANQPGVADSLRQVMLGTKPESVVAALHGMAERPDSTERLGSIDVPALLICGAEDGITPPDEMRSMAERLPNAEFAEIPQAGHMAPLERPDAVNARIRDFVQRFV